MSRARRGLFLTHRWIGIALAVPMLAWFVSGVVMMYVGYPKLSEAERLAALPPLRVQGCCAPLQAVLAAGASGRPVSELRLTTIADRPTWIVQAGGPGHGTTMVAVDARDARRRVPADATRARESALAFARGPADVAATPARGAAIRNDIGPVRTHAAAAAPADAVAAPRVDTVREDAWTHSRALDPHRPLHRVELGDATGTRLYVSSATGEVVRDATRRERGWNWIGAWLHWLYAFRGGVLDGWWHELVVGLSLAGTLAAATGLVVGTLRWRVRSRYASGARTPYRHGSMRWHHVCGLAFALTTLAWIASGLASMNPWKAFDSGAPPLDERAYAGVALEAARLSARAAQPASVLARLPHGFEARELRYAAIDGRVHAVAFDAAGRTRLVPADDPIGAPLETLPLDALARAAARLVPHARVESVETVARHDFWWVARAPHTMLGHIERRLPVLRVRFDDPHGTWVHVDPFTGATSRLDRRARVKRWAFALLHSWDWPPLLATPLAWQALLIVASLGGVVLTATGTVIGWRRLRRAATRSGQAAGCLKATGNSSSLGAVAIDAQAGSLPGSPIETDR